MLHLDKKSIMKFLEKALIHLELYSYLFFSIVYVFQSIILAMVPRHFRRRDVSGQLVLITGGAMGIGKLTAKKLAQRGAKVIIWDVNKEVAAETEKEIRNLGNECYSYIVDVTDWNAVKDAAKQVKEKHGMVNILVNNAGILRENDLLTDSEDLIVQHFQVNTLSNFWTIRAFLPDMKKAKEGHIVTMSSIGGKFGTPKMSIYCATKFALCGLDESLRYELDGEGLHNITTTLVCPFFVNTTMTKGIKTRLYPTLSTEYVSDEIVDGILMRTRRLILPPVMRIMTALKGLLHYKMETTVSQASIGKDPTLTAEWKLKKEKQF